MNRLGKQSSNSAAAIDVNLEDQLRDISTKTSYNFKYGNKISSIPLYHYELNQFTYDFIKTYLYGISRGYLKLDEFKITFFQAIASNQSPIAIPPSVSYGEEGLFQVENSIIFCECLYNEAKYAITIMSLIYGLRDEMHYQISVAGEDENSIETKILCSLICNNAIIYSRYRNQTLRVIKENTRDDENLNLLKIDYAELEENILDDILLYPEVREELDKFIYCVHNYNDVKTPLRYLLSGPPGTAKTMIIRSIANACRDFATTILTSGSDTRINSIFTFANLFSPSIICIDDIDFMAENRNFRNSNSLCDFLQQMDGFMKKNVFVIATTNDKNLVDVAASRPGRFDMILDIGYLESNNYLALIQKNTDDDEILSLFNENVLSMFRSKKITGSFLVNLLKQITIKKDILKNEKRLEEKDIISLINKTYKGFYKEPKYEKVGFGFEEN